MKKPGVSRRSVLGGIAAGSGLAAAGIIPRSAWAQGGPISLGCVQTLTGSLGVIGQAHIVGAEIAVEMINDAGGLDGRMVRLETRDTQISAATAVAALREFSGNGTNLVVGEAFSSVNLAAAPLLSELDMLMASPSTVAMELTHEMYTPNFFRCGPNSYMQYNGEAVLMSREFPEVTRWGGIQIDNAGFRSGYEMITEGLKSNYAANGTEVEVLDPILVKVGTTDFRTVISQLLGRGIEGFILMSTGQDAVTFIRQAKPFGLFNNIKVVADNNISIAAGPNLKQDIPNNFFTTCYWMPDAFSGVPMAVEFTERYRARTGQDTIDPYSSMAHTAVMGIAGAISAAGSTETEAVREALSTTPFDSVHGELAYRTEDNQLQLDPSYAEFRPLEEEPGYEIPRFISIPWEDAIEPASPGTPFTF